MSIEFIPPEHLAFLMAAAVKAAGLKGAPAELWMQKAGLAHDAGNRAEVLKFIETQTPGALGDIDDRWPFLGGRSVLVWLLPCLEKLSVKEALQRHAKAPYSKPSRKWQDVPKRGKGPDAVRKIRVTETEIHVEVWRLKKFTFEHEGSRKSELKTVKVTLRVDFAKSLPSCEVYTSLQDARGALFAFLDWLRGEDTPRLKSPAQAKLLTPLLFTEKLVDKMAERLKWQPPTIILGPDPTGEVGERQLIAKKQGTEYVPLDVTTDSVKQQLLVPNTNRRYSVKYKHVDGFVEVPHATFHFLGAQPSVLFHTRTSRPAIDHVIMEVRKELKA